MQVKMMTYLQAFDLWEVVNIDAEPAPLRANPTVAQIKHHAGSWLVRLPSKLGTSSRRSSKMKEEETIKKYSDRIMAVVNSIRLLGEQFDEARIVEKEQRRVSRMEEYQEGAFLAKTKSASSSSAYKGKKNWKNRPKPDAARGGDRLCRFCKRPGHPETRCWFRPDAVCQHCKKKGHAERVYKEKCRPGQNQQHKGEEARVAEDNSDHEEQVFAVGCTNHRSPDATIFKTLDRSCKTKVKVGNRKFIKAEGKGDVLICTPTGNKVIPNVLLVPEIDRNLLSISQLLEKWYSVVFKDQECQITDPNRSSLITVTISDKCFEVNWSGDSYSAHVASIEDTKLWHQ
ncbi:uncharacterized protein LOC108451059 [Gossypium arboreum]|uniref:uncharacterized protein LOC108451059 n=1 Tax=Gossypium arboreum TaxID=29729 RepID=UPI0008196455|nr:uncharacterized protein LOC108451059 [Gossypium arboreum]